MEGQDRCDAEEAAKSPQNLISTAISKDQPARHSTISNLGIYHGPQRRL
jgi:hypothetical protein